MERRSQPSRPEWQGGLAHGYGGLGRRRGKQTQGRIDEADPVALGRAFHQVRQGEQPRADPQGRWQRRVL